MKSIVIGITGGIGSGKSTVSSIFSESNFPVLNSDEIAKEIMNSDENVIKRIIKEFGDECYLDNKLNTKIVAEKIFTIKENIKKINSIVHPPTLKKIESEIKSLSGNKKLIFVESALIFEAKMEYLVDYILLVTADEDIRIDRIAAKGKETLSEIKDRIANQSPEDQKKGKSDFIIENNSSLKELREKTNFFLNLFNSLNK